MLKAKDLGTNKEQSITITASTNLSDEEVERMMKEAEENAEEDKKRKEQADTRNDAEQMIFQTEKALKDLGDKVDSKEKEEAEELIEDLKKELEGDNFDEIKAKTEKLQEKAMALATKVYENIQKEQAASNNNDSDNTTESNDDVKEADYEEE